MREGEKCRYWGSNQFSGKRKVGRCVRREGQLMDALRTSIREEKSH